MDIGQLGGQGPGERLLVLGMAVGVQQADRHRLGLTAGDGASGGPCGLLGELGQGAIGGHPLRSAEPALGWRQRGRPGRAQPVELAAVLAPEGDQVGEALGGHEDGARPPSLEQRVRGHGHPVRERTHVGRRRSGRLEDGSDGLEHALGLVVGRARRLGRDEPTLVGEHGIGEGPADIDAQEHR